LVVCVVVFISYFVAAVMANKDLYIKTPAYLISYTSASHDGQRFYCGI